MGCAASCSGVTGLEALRVNLGILSGGLCVVDVFLMGKRQQLIHTRKRAKALGKKSVRLWHDCDIPGRAKQDLWSVPRNTCTT